MVFRNRELGLEVAASLILTAVLLVLGALVKLPLWAGLLICCALLTAVHFCFTFRRYHKLQKLCLNVDELLHNGKVLAIREYEEGELSLLANQIQKMTLRLTEAASAAQSEKNHLADSLTDISHQLRTPLTAMNLTVAMLSKSDLADAQRLKLARELKKQLSRTDWLVDALLKMSKLDAGTVTLARDRVRVDQVLARAAESLAIPMELREQRLAIQCDDAGFTGDEAWTAEAIGNILKNAMEHTPDGGSITVMASETALFTEIAITDTGSGFAAEDIPHLFERFYKGKNASGDSFGIGLALARTIIVAQNGTIQAANTSAGAKFTIKLYKQVV